MSFFNLYRHHFVRIAVGIPEVRLADPVFNAGQAVDLMKEAAQRKAMLTVFPELVPSAGIWPDIPEHERHQYGIAEIKKWLEVFLRRFFEHSQYKRSAIPNAPKVGSGGSLSPRGDYRAPSDLVAADAWISQLDAIPDDEPQSV